jgi:hypothetical protein
VGDVGELEREPKLGHPVLPHGRAGGEDVDLVLAQGRGHVAQQLLPIEGFDLDRHHERRPLAGPP